MDVKELFAATVKAQQSANKPRTFMIVAEADAAFSPTNPNIFRVRGVRTDTNERVFVIASKANAGQITPKQGDVLRADKSVKTGMHPSGEIPIFTADYFHTYEKGFCLTAVMQPLPVRKNNNMQDASVLAYDPAGPASVLFGSQLTTDLVSEIIKHLKPWASSEQSAITHDLAGRPLWASGPTNGMTPVAVIRWAGQSARVFGLSGVRIDPNDKAAGYRYPNDSELAEKVKSHPAVQNILRAIGALSAEHADKCDQIDVSVLPGVALAVGRDMILFNNKANREYFSVPDAYKVMVEGKESFFGHKNTYIHLKQTRTGRVGVVDTAPAPGRMTPGVPLFAAEVEREKYRQDLAAGITTTVVNNAPQAPTNQRPLTRNQLAAVDDFDASDDAPAVAAKPVGQAPQQQAVSGSFEDDDDHDDRYDMSGFAEDLAVIEGLSKDLIDDDINSLFEEAHAISEARSRPQPRLG